MTDWSTNSGYINETMASNARQLQNLWRDFQSSQKQSDRLDLDTVDPSADGIKRLINNALAARGSQGNGGAWSKVKYRFHRICSCLDAHKSLISLLPESSEYVSLFTGCITVIIQVRQLPFKDRPPFH